MMGYDRAIVTFSPEGRLFQVEYAREAVKHGTTSLGITFGDGVIFAATRIINDLEVAHVGGEKVFQIDDNLGATISGFLADGRVLVEKARLKAQVYRLTYDEPLDVLGSVKELSNMMQIYTQYGGVRPFGVTLLLGGLDEKGSQLFEIDPSSTFYSWKAHAIGRGSSKAIGVLKKSWKSNMEEKAAIKLAVKALKTAEKDIKPSGIEMAIINSKGFRKYYGDKGLKFIKKYW